MMQKPDVDQIDGLSPAIAIEQKTTSKNPRSTVGTVTEIHDYMRLLWARVGVPYSPATGLPIESQTVSQMVDRVLALPERTRLYLNAPVVRGRKGEYRKEIADYMKRGFQRLKIDGEFYEIADAPALDKKVKHDIEVVVDRLVVRPDLASRLAESFETALELADGLAIVEIAEERRVANSEIANGEAPHSPLADSPIRLASSNPLLLQIRLPGLRLHHPRDRAAAVLVQQPLRRLPGLRRARLGADGRRQPRRPRPAPELTQGRGGAVGQVELALLPADAGGARPRTTSSASTSPGRACRQKAREVILNGSGDEEVRFAYDDGLRSYEVKKPFEGVVKNLERRYRETESEWSREEIERFMTATPCVACQGFRLKPEALAVKIDGKHIGEVSLLSVKAAVEWARALPARARRQAQRDRPARPQGDRRPADLPFRRRPRLSDPVARVGHAVGRREPAHPPRLADRLGPHRRALRARRAVDRPAPARQRAPARHAAGACASSATR